MTDQAAAPEDADTKLEFDVVRARAQKVANETGEKSPITSSSRVQPASDGAEVTDVVSPNKLSFRAKFDRRPFRAQGVDRFHSGTRPLKSMLYMGHLSDNLLAMQGDGIRRVGKYKEGRSATVAPFGPHPVLLRIGNAQENRIQSLMEAPAPGLVLQPLKLWPHKEEPAAVLPQVFITHAPRNSAEYRKQLEYSRFLELLTLACGQYSFDCRPNNVGVLRHERVPVLFDQATMVHAKHQFELLSEYTYQEMRDYHIKRELHAAESVCNYQLPKFDDEKCLRDPNAYPIPGWYTHASFLASPPFDHWLEKIFDEKLTDRLLRETGATPDDSTSHVERTAVGLVKLESLITQGEPYEVLAQIERLQPLMDDMRAAIDLFYVQEQKLHRTALGLPDTNPIDHESLIKDSEFKDWLAAHSRHVPNNEHGNLVHAIEFEGWNRDAMHRIVLDAATEQERRRENGEPPNWESCVDKAQAALMAATAR